MDKYTVQTTAEGYRVQPKRECCNYCMWLGPINSDGTMRKHRPATLEDKWGRPNQVQDMSLPHCHGSHKAPARFGCDSEPAPCGQKMYKLSGGVVHCTKPKGHDKAHAAV